MSNQFGIKEVLNYTVRNFATGAPVFFADYASSIGVETTGERLDIRGGQGNYKLLSFDHTKDMVFNSSLPLVDLNALAMITGRPLSVGAVIVPARRVLNASATHTITLPHTPLVGSLRIFRLSSERDDGVEQLVGTPATVPNTYSISGMIVTLNATTAPLGTAFVVYYNYTSVSTAQRITMTADRFPSAVSISGEGLWRNQVTELDTPVVFDVRRARVRPSFTLSMAADSATVLELVYDMFPVNESGELVFMHITRL